MFELTTGADVLGLQSVAEVAELHRRRGSGYYGGYGRSRKSVCLVTGNYSLNGVSVLNILNGFGSW